MIELVTGLPGAGKTLHTIWRYKKISEADARPIYYHGIKDLALPWIELSDPQKWYEVEPNAIVIIDECQRVFRPAGPQNGVPEHIAQMETHRHSGIDLVLLTQQPMLVHRNVRELVGRHLHVVRIFGMQRSNIHEWDQCRDNPRTNRKDSRSSVWAFPREAFSYYKSAEVHTHKRNIPLRVWLGLGAVASSVAFGWMGWQNLSKVSGAAGVAAASAPLSAQSAPGQQPGAGSRPVKQTPAEWMADRTPRIAGLAHTAPAYDDVTQPTVAPYPAACVTIRGGCQCYSQQGTRLDTPADLCHMIVDRGFFLDFQTRPADAQQQQAERAASVSG